MAVCVCGTFCCMASSLASRMCGFTLRVSCKPGAAGRRVAADDEPSRFARLRAASVGKMPVTSEPGLQGARCAGYWTTCWKVGRLTQGIEGTVPTPMALYWMSSSSGLHLLASFCPEPASAPPVSLAREQVQLVGSLLRSEE